MGENTSGRRYGQHMKKPPCVIVVSVAQHNSIRFRQISAETTRVVATGIRLTRVEKDASTVKFQPEA